MVSMEQARRERNARMCEVLSLVDFGMIWWASEAIWKSRVTGYDQESTRESHPSISLRSYNLATSLDPIPLLHGTSNPDFGRVVVRDITPGHTTHFGQIPPVGVPFDYWVGGGQDRLIRKNESKSSVNEGEAIELSALCRRKGWL